MTIDLSLESFIIVAALVTLAAAINYRAGGKALAVATILIVWAGLALLTVMAVARVVSP